MENTFSASIDTKQANSPDHEATLELIELGIKLADRGISISEAAIHAWMRGPKGAPFPQPDTVE